MKSLNIAAGLLLVGCGFLVAFSPIPLALPWGSFYAVPVTLAGILAWLTTRNPRRANLIAIGMIIVLLATILFAVWVASNVVIGHLL